MDPCKAVTASSLVHAAVWVAGQCASSRAAWRVWLVVIEKRTVPWRWWCPSAIETRCSARWCCRRFHLVQLLAELVHVRSAPETLSCFPSQFLGLPLSIKTAIWLWQWQTAVPRGSVVYSMQVCRAKNGVCCKGAGRRRNVLRRWVVVAVCGSSCLFSFNANAP